MRCPLIPTVLGWWLVLTLTVITAIDIIALVNGRQEDTVSRWVYELGHSHPWVYLLIGITLGHILFPLLLNNGNNHD